MPAFGFSNLTVRKDTLTKLDAYARKYGLRAPQLVLMMTDKIDSEVDPQNLLRGIELSSTQKISRVIEVVTLHASCLAILDSFLRVQGYLELKLERRRSMAQTASKSITSRETKGVDKITKFGTIMAAFIQPIWKLEKPVQVCNSIALTLVSIFTALWPGEYEQRKEVVDKEFSMYPKPLYSLSLPSPLPWDDDDRSDSFLKQYMNVSYSEDKLLPISKIFEDAQNLNKAVSRLGELFKDDEKALKLVKSLTFNLSDLASTLEAAREPED